MGWRHESRNHMYRQSGWWGTPSLMPGAPGWAPTLPVSQPRTKSSYIVILNIKGYIG